MSDLTLDSLVFDDDMELAQRLGQQLGPDSFWDMVDPFGLVFVGPAGGDMGLEDVAGQFAEADVTAGADPHDLAPVSGTADYDVAVAHVSRGGAHGGAVSAEYDYRGQQRG